MALTAQAAEQQGAKRTIILIVVILMHLGGFWALQNGLARRLVELLPNDIKTEIIKEDKHEEPPPPPPPPDQQTPPPPFVPPVEVAIAVPVETPANTITTTNEKPPVTAPLMVAENIRKGSFDPKHPIRSSEDFYPQESIRAGEEGVTVVEIYVATDGHVTDARIKTSSGFDRLDQAAMKYAKTWRMLPQTRNGVAEGSWLSVPIRWKIANR